MEKKDKPNYDSKRILGILYDEVKLCDCELYINEAEEIKATSSFPYKAFSFKGEEEYIKEARIIKNGYDLDLKRIMRQYGIKHEVEVVSGYLLRFTSKQYSKQTNIFDLRNEISHAYRITQEK